jgi:hypothetical protein
VTHLTGRRLVDKSRVHLRKRGDPTTDHPVAAARGGVSSVAEGVAFEPTMGVTPVRMGLTVAASEGTIRKVWFRAGAGA